MQFKWLSPMIVVLALMLAVGLVAAQDEATAEPEATTEPDVTSETMTPPLGWRHHHFPIAEILEATGLTLDELRTALAEGSTIAELIEANGGDVDALVAAWVAEREEALAEYEANLTAWLNGEIAALPGYGFGMGRDFFGGRGGLQSAALLEATGLTATELRTALADGSTIAELVEANGGDLETLIADAVAAHEERLATAVENERITQEEANERLASYEENLTAWVNGEADFDFSFGPGDGMPGGGPGGRGGRGGGR